MSQVRGIRLRCRMGVSPVQPGGGARPPSDKSATLVFGLTHVILADAYSCSFSGEGLMTVSRRDFLATAVAGSLAVGLPEIASATQDSAAPKPNAASGKRPIIV